MKLGVILLPLLIFVSGCYNPSDNDNVECTADSECVPAGCSSQLCVSADKSSDVITTCEYKEEYSCLKLTNCGCVDNNCQWLSNDKYNKCLEEVKA